MWYKTTTVIFRWLCIQLILPRFKVPCNISKPLISIYRKFENIYIGHGHKYQADNFSPTNPPGVLEEYPSGPDVLEMDDPTVEDEQALKKAQEEAMRAAEEMDDMDDDDDED